MNHYSILAVFVVVDLIIIIMYLFLKKAVSKVNQQSKNYFLDKIHVYDELIESKEKKLDELNSKIETIKEESSKEDVDNNLSVYVYNDKKIEYKDEDIFEKIKKIDEKFKIDEETIINEFINNNKNYSKIDIYNDLIEIKKKFNSDIIYKLSIKNKKDQIKELKKILEDKYDIFENLLKEENSDIFNLISNLDESIEENDPHFYIYVGRKEQDYNYINPYIITKLDESIFKGIMIIYDKKVHDYSIKTIK